MLIVLLLISTFALLAGLRALALIGRKRAVHYGGPGIEQAARDQRRLEREFGMHKYAHK